VAREATVQQFATPDSARFSTANVDACRDYINASTGTHEFDITRASTFRDFVHHECPIGRISLNRVNLDCTDGFRITKSDAAPYYSFQFLLDGECRVDGPFGTVLAKPGDVFILDPDQVTREFWSRNCLQFILRVDREYIEQTIMAELGRTLGSHLVFDPHLPDPGIGSWLDRIVEGFKYGSGSPILGDRRVVKGFEQTLVTMLLTGLHHSESEEYSRPVTVAAPYYVKRAENFIRAHLNDELTVDSIASAAGVSARSMFYGFKRWRGTTPMAFVRNARLDVARKELEAARHTGATVSQAAINAGFTNFSQFSKIYKARFGETPSATLIGK
jgi:AraC-like DNA-binding protein